MANGAPTVSNGLVISGVTTSTTFSGSGASLTNIPSAQLTGALPALDGSNLTGITQTTINNNANNRIITGSGTANTLEAESSITYDGTKVLNISSSAGGFFQGTDTDGGIGLVEMGNGNVALQADTGNSISGSKIHFFVDNSEKMILDDSGRLLIGTTTPGNSTADDLTIANATNAGITIRGATNGESNIFFGDGTSGGDQYRGMVRYYHNGDALAFHSGGGERLRITQYGNIGINTTSPENNSNDVSLHIHGTANDDCRIAFSTPTKSNPGSRIGYYGLNRFGIDCYDGLEVRDVTASYATRLKIDQNGYLTLPNTPAASAYVSSSSPGAANNKIQNATLGLNNTHYNNGGHFNTSNYRFTCPVTGYYKVSFSTNLHTSNHSDGNNYQINLQVNGSTRHIHYDTKQSTHTWLFMGWAETVYCSANDYISLYVQGSAVLGVDASSAWNRTTFELIG